jgi:hypothetical protein
MGRYITADVIVGFVLLILCCIFTYLAFFVLIDSIPPFFRNQPMRLDTMPRILGIFGIIASVITIVSPIISKVLEDVLASNKSADEAEPEDAQTKSLKESKERMADLSFATFGEAKWGQLAAMIALMIVYASFLRLGGFIPTTFFLLLTGSIILGERRWVGMILTSLIAPLAIWLLVTFVLDRTIVPLPAPLMNLIGG